MIDIINETRKQIQVLGIFQLVTYIGIGLGLANQMPEETYGPFGFASFGLNSYLLAAFALVPSASIFILEPTRRNLKLLRVARGLQIALFVAVCFAIIPASLMAQFFQGSSWLVIACLLGIVYFFIMNSLVGKVISPKSQKTATVTQTKKSPESTPAGVHVSTMKSATNHFYCPKCGVPVVTIGNCGNCAQTRT